MPVYKSKLNEPQTIYVDMTFLPGKDKSVLRYVNLDKYPFLEKISDDPFTPDRVIFNSVNSAGISSLQDFYRSITLRVVDGDSPVAVGSTVDISILSGDTDDINDFIILSELQFTKKVIISDVSLWGSDINLIKNVEANAFKFYYVAITSISVDAPVTIYVKSIY